MLNLLNNCILAKSTPQRLPLNEEYNFKFLNFLIIASWSSLAYCILALLLATQLPCNALARKTLSAMVLFAKSLRSP